MFKKIQWKMVWVFMLLVTSIMVATGAFIIVVTIENFGLQNVEMTQILNNIFIVIGSALLASFVAAIVFGYFSSRTITKPISNLTKTVRNLGKGQFDVLPDSKAKDEIGELTRAFKNMGEMIKNTVGQMASEKNKVETILQNLTDGVITFDSGQNIIHINNNAADVLKLPNEPTEILFDELFEKLDVEICMAEFLYLNHVRTVERQIQVDDKLLDAKFVPFQMGNEKTAGVVVVLHDITKQAEADISRRDFVANVSHELQTPLTTVKTYAETLVNNKLDEEVALGFTKIIETEADRMSRIVKDLLDISKYDSKRVEWTRTHFSPDQLLTSIVNRLEVSAGNNNQTLTYSRDTELPPRIYADRDKIEQVIINLVSNAMKYSKGSGKIEIFAGCVFNELYIKVRDNGIGIPKKDLPNIFDRFYRADKARTRQHGGTGLGLAITKEIIANHGGTIKIDSEYGKFTEVIIKLPVLTEEIKLN